MTDGAGHAVSGAGRVILPPVLRSGVATGAGVRLVTDHPALDVTGGRIAGRATDPVTAVIQVVPAAADGRSAEPEAFAVTVLPAAAPALLAGTRRPDPDPDVYPPRLALGLHLTLVSAEGAVTRLNDGRAVLFPRSVPTGHLDVRRVRTLHEPWVFATPDGYSVVASPGRRDGSPEPAADSSVLVFRSADLIHYEEIGLVPVSVGGGVRRPRGVYDSARAEYVLWWRDDAGRDWSARSATVPGPWGPATPGAPAVPGIPVPEPAGSDVPACALPLTEEAAERLRRRFGRIRNVAAEVPPLLVTAGEPARDLPWAELTYDDGSTARRPVDWDPAGLAGVDWGTPGEYVVAGTVRQRVYPFPFVVDRADPTVLAHGGRWYLIATDDPGGDCVSTTGLLIRTADSIAGLATAADHAILGVGAAGIAGCFWAPELHVFGGRLHCFFAPCVGAADWKRVQCHVMRLREGGNPAVAADWEPPRPVRQADGSPLQLDAEHPGLSLDMTCFEDAGRRYVVWSQRYITDRIGDAELWIATIDPADPWRLTSDPVRLVGPGYGWDDDVAEGPFLVRHGDRLVLTYSGSAVGPTYAAGALEATGGADLLDPGVWTRTHAPVLGTGGHFGHWGPGHNTFGHDEDGLEIVAFHAHPTIATRGRCTALRRTHWAADGHLVLDQRPDEEVAPHLREVRAVVRVAPPPGS
ncbi:family 43 glycosylhydrolase [Dactylosporangium sp. NBC_01737]|uniref:family 43 glycosylhydrolase n=1 Tax=Dactylosporangium sp. NBC_01737 TaxID=2975959 RepID=UPI002E0E48AD|nr:family 43 glycosylhydrolase [Dactylosporangium sp. NBC_01737]